MLLHEHKQDIGIILLPGFAPDSVPVEGIQKELAAQGYHAVAANFWGKKPVSDFSSLTLEQCKTGVAQLVAEMSRQYSCVIGIGVSLGGALLLEHAKDHGDLSCIVSIGTPFRLKHRGWMKLGFAVLPVAYLGWKIAKSLGQKRPLPIGCAKMAVDYLEGSFLAGFENIQVPVLFLHSKNDSITDYRAVEEYVAKISSTHKEIIYFETNNHVIEYDGDLILKTLEKFLNDPDNTIFASPPKSAASEKSVI